ncbi:MAG TPA: fumarylacetoacetate hydrolase family protein [Polyangiaceae bacterium]|nr:fumarylacetoacetate hydrolase family protein [Polyangiaceae bacterium]
MNATGAAADALELDEPLQRGLAEHVRRLKARFDAGETRLGWKVAFNVRPVQEALGIPFSLVAGLTRSTLESSSAHSLSGSTRVALEAEVAVRLKRDVAPDMTEAELSACVDVWAPAIEVVDLNRPFSELESILGEGVFHRAVFLGPAVPVRPGADLAGVRALVHFAGDRSCDLDAREATGHVPDMLRHLARLLARFGEKLQRDDWIILGSMNPPLLARPGTEFSLELSEIGRVAITLTP